MNSKLTKLLLLVWILLVSTVVIAQKELTINTIPSDADIYEIVGENSIKRGSGTATVKLEKEKPTTFEARRPGYVPVQKTVIREKKGEPVITLELTQRYVQINTTPADATIYLNSKEIGKTPQFVTIPKGVSATIEVKKVGYQPMSKVLYNKQGEEVPELSYLFKLEDRVVSIKSNPADAIIYVDGKLKAEGSAQIIIPKDKCVVVKVEKSSYISNEVTYCNKETENIPPLSEEIRLKDRSIQINAIPEDAKIYIDNKQVAKGSFTLKLPFGKCSKIKVMKQGYVGELLEICNQTDATPADPSYSFSLKQDEAYLQSEESNQANTTFNIQVDSMPMDKAWKKLVSIVQSRFDEIEITDPTTHYLKTNWVGKVFNDGSIFRSMMRTRLIITDGGDNKFNVKIQSEISKPESICVRETNNDISNNSKSSISSLTVNNDECFEPVNRLLRKYSDIVSEMQRRIK